MLRPFRLFLHNHSPHHLLLPGAQADKVHPRGHFVTGVIPPGQEFPCAIHPATPLKYAAVTVGKLLLVSVITVSAISLSESGDVYCLGR